MEQFAAFQNGYLSGKRLKLQGLESPPYRGPEQPGAGAILTYSEEFARKRR